MKQIYMVMNGSESEFYGTQDECLEYIIKETEGTSEHLIDEDYTTLIDGGEVHGYQILEEEEDEIEKPEQEETEFDRDDEQYESALAVSYERRYGQ